MGTDTPPTILLEKSDRVPGYREGWPSGLLAYLLTPLATDSRAGSAFAEWNNPNVELRVTDRTERMLVKSERIVRECLIPTGRFLEFITFLSRDVLRANPATIASGVVHVRFLDENDDRYFTLYVRRSAVLVPFFQMDQFRSHL